MIPKGTPKSTQIRSKNASEKSSKKRRWFAARWRVRSGQQAGGTESAFVGKLDVLLLYLTCAFSPFCHVVVCKLVCWACLLMLLLMLLLPAISVYFVLYSDMYFLLFPTISWYFLLFHGISCYFLLPAISCYFLVFQLIPAISNYLLLFPIISKNVMLSPTIPYYFLRFLLFPMISC